MLPLILATARPGSDKVVSCIARSMPGLHASELNRAPIFRFEGLNMVEHGRAWLRIVLSATQLGADTIYVGPDVPAHDSSEVVCFHRYDLGLNECVARAHTVLRHTMQMSTACCYNGKLQRYE